MLCQRFGSLTLVATVTAVVSALLGLLASCWLDLPSGAAIVLLQGLIFGAAWSIGSLRRTA
jgi:ABC-type Mn2+/Zn2+ transport system permease subunit